MNKYKNVCQWILASLLCCVVFASHAETVQTPQRAMVTAQGAAATVHPLATEAAMQALSQGGNAIDAAIAAAAMLGVVDGYNSGIGGGCFALVRLADGRVFALDGREMAPAAATRDMFIREGKAEPALSQTGALAIGIPGSVAVLAELSEKIGKRPWASLWLPAAERAEHGFVVSEQYAERLNRVADKMALFPSSAAIFLDKDGQPWPAGHVLKQPDLAETYRRLAQDYSDYFYQGDFAKQTAQWVQQHGGIITTKDFAQYTTVQREPLHITYRGYDVYGFPPPSSGGVHVAQILNILENVDLATLNEADRAHMIAEAMRLAFADRAYWLGDSDFVPVPKGLMDKAYAKKRFTLIEKHRANPAIDHGQPFDVSKELFGKHTTHIATADAQGNWVALTTTINTTFGSKVVIPGTGVLMNNQMDDFSIQPGVANAFGLVGAEANSVAAFKRPLSSMSPTLVLKAGQPVMTVGAAGGPTIITQVVQALINHLDLQLPLYEALAKPRIHHQWRPDQLHVENTMAPSLRSALEARGHVIKPIVMPGMTQAISVDKAGRFNAVAEPRLP